MKNQTINKYGYTPNFTLPDRTWPDQIITAAPTWCSVDLRDGNQALPEPMTIHKKLKMFHTLVNMGFREIEVGFPAASKIEFDFVRRLIMEEHIPDQVTIQVLTQARPAIIEQTFKALNGARQAIVHLYNSTSTLQRKVVFKKDQTSIKEIAVRGARLMQSLKQERRFSHFQFQYSPESFTGTEMDFALEVCNAVLDVWQPTQKHKSIINLPATVEMTGPHIYADQVEWMHRNISKREAVSLSVHTHNDRGSAIAASELAMQAGAERVEGTLFGNGERTGNLDIVTMALNMFTHGVSPQLNFRDLPGIQRIFGECTGMPVHPRHPYAGELVFTAFSGSHQDAIHKGMHSRRQSGNPIWEVPYLPLDPEDIGKTYKALIRINSQSGKGGMAYIMEHEYGYRLPKAMHPEFSSIIQRHIEKNGRELRAQELWDIFAAEYLDQTSPYKFQHCDIHTEHQEDSPCHTRVETHLKTMSNEISFSGYGNGPVDAFIKGLRQITGICWSIEKFEEHALDHRSSSQAIAYIQMSDGFSNLQFGVGVDTHTSLAAIKACLSAMNRCLTSDTSRYEWLREHATPSMGS